MSRTLEGVGIVLTRPRHAAEGLAATLRHEGARVFLFPALAIEPLPASAGLRQALGHLAECDLAIFVSANAAEHGLAAAQREGPWPSRVAVAAVGEATAEALRNSGFGAVISPPERHDSDGLLALPQLQAVAGKRIMIFRGAGGRERLKDVLEARGATVEYAECYRRVRPESDAAPIVAAFGRGEIHAVSVLSAETLENFVEMIGGEGARHLGAATLVVPHPAIAAHRDARRFTQVAVTGHGAPALVATLARLAVTP